MRVRSASSDRNPDRAGDPVTSPLFRSRRRCSDEYAGLSIKFRNAPPPAVPIQLGLQRLLILLVVRKMTGPCALNDRQGTVCSEPRAGYRQPFRDAHRWHLHCLSFSFRSVLVSPLTSTGGAIRTRMKGLPLLKLCSSFSQKGEKQQYVRNKYAYWIQWPNHWP